jgi:hypothetical protein
MITGLHTIIYSRDAESDRAFMRNTLGFASVDAGQGWLIFAMPPTELAVHPAESNGRHELYLTCDDVEAEIVRLSKKGAVRAPCSGARHTASSVVTSLSYRRMDR